MSNRNHADQDNQWIYELEKCQSKILGLPNKVMELICRFLPTRADQFNACLIHPIWETAARNILWEAPKFYEPASFRAFVNTVMTTKKCALAVRSLSMCADGPDNHAIFKPIDNSDLKLHDTQLTTLSNPSFIRFMASRCEKLKSLKIYGYNLEGSHVETLASILSDLTDLHIIGNKRDPQDPSSPHPPPFVINSNILSRLRSLSLDGVFSITTSFSKTLATRCHNLQSIHLSLAGMSANGLAELCSHDILDLKELVFTHAAHIKDSHMTHVLKTFPNLVRLAVENAGHLTVETIRDAFTYSRFLEDLDIRGNSAYQLPLPNKDSGIDDEETWTVAPNMYRLAIHHLEISNTHLTHILRACPSLTVFGISDCDSLTDEPLEKSFGWLNKLEVAHIIQCKKIGSKTINAMIKKQTRKTIREVNFEGSGHIRPSDIYQLCRETHIHHLKTLRLVNYPELMDSTIGHFATVLQEKESIMILDEKAIELLVDTPMEQYSDLDQKPQARFLSGDQIIALATELQLSLPALEHILNKVQIMAPDSSEQESDENSSSSQVLHKYSNSEYDNQTNKSQAEYTDNSTERTTSQLSTQWPGTSLPLKTSEPETGVSSPEIQNRSSTQDYTSESERDTSGSLLSASSFIGSPSDRPEMESTENINNEKSLGGWTQSDGQDWAKGAEISTLNPKANHDRKPAQGDSKQKDAMRWNASRGQPMSNGTANKKFNAVFGAEEGWGNVENVVPWEQTKGYVPDVLEAQSNTIYWEQTRDGEWSKLSARKFAELPPAANNQRLSTPISRTPRRRTRAGAGGGSFRSSDDSSDNSDSEVMRTDIVYNPAEGSFQPKTQKPTRTTALPTRPRSQSPKTTNLPKYTATTTTATPTTSTPTTIEGWNKFRASSTMSANLLPNSSSRNFRQPQPRAISGALRKKQGTVRQAIPPGKMTGSWGSYSAQATAVDDQRPHKLIDTDDIVQPHSNPPSTPEYTKPVNADLKMLAGIDLSFPKDDNENKQAYDTPSESNIPAEVIIWSNNSDSTSKQPPANSHQEQKHWGGLTVNKDQVEDVDTSKDSLLLPKDPIQTKEKGAELTPMPTSPPFLEPVSNQLLDSGTATPDKPVETSPKSSSKEKPGKRATFKISTKDHGVQCLLFFEASKLL
ncbi:hypothetical protein F4703DRAFT_1043514 [Phycomyces blakesleeanus]